MAVDWTELFTRLGRLVYTFNLFETYQSTTIIGLVDAIMDEYEDDRELIDGILSLSDEIQVTMSSRKRVLAEFSTKTLLDPDLLTELGASSTNLTSLFDLLITRMIDDGETIEASTFTVGTATMGGSNVGNGAIYASNLRWDGDLEERLHPETFNLKCVRDAQVSGTSGQEAFQLRGEIPSASQPYGPGPFRSGVGPQTISLIGSNQFLDNDGFENFTVANTPDDWTVDAGVVGTHILEEAAEKVRGSKSLEFAGDGAQASIQISQDVTDHLLPEELYTCGIWIKTSGVTAGTITVILTGTGFVPTGTKLIEIAAAWPAAWTHYKFFVETPRDLPTDVKLVIKVTGTPNAASHFYFDCVALARPTRFANLSWAVFPGSTDWVIKDEATVAIARTNKGTFQTWFGEIYNVQLPSDAVPTILDALAE